MILIKDLYHLKLPQAACGSFNAEEGVSVLECLSRIQCDALRHALVLEVTGHTASYRAQILRTVNS